MYRKHLAAMLLFFVLTLYAVPEYTGFSTDTPPPPLSAVDGYVIVSQDGHVVLPEDQDSGNKGKLKVTLVVKNESDAENRNIYNLVAEGYDAKGNIIDVETLSRVNLPVGQSQKLSVYMNLGSEIATYHTYLVSAKDLSGKWEMVSSAQRMVTLSEPNIYASYDAGRLLVQAIVKNGTPENVPELVTFVAEGYDKNGKCIEVASSSKVNIGTGFTAKMSVLFKAPAQIDKVKTYLVDGIVSGTKWQLMTTSSRIVDRKELDASAAYDAGKFKVQAVVKNNVSQASKELCTLIVEGYDLTGKCIEVGTSRMVNIGKGFTANLSVLLGQGQKIRTYKARLVDGDSAEGKILLITTANHLIGKDESPDSAGKLSVTGIVKNSFPTEKKVKVSLLAYNFSGKLVASQSKILTLNAGYCTAVTFQISGGTAIKNTKFVLTENK